MCIAGKRCLLGIECGYSHPNLTGKEQKFFDRICDLELGSCDVTVIQRIQTEIIEKSKKYPSLKNKTKAELLKLHKTTVKVTLQELYKWNIPLRSPVISPKIRDQNGVVQELYDRWNQSQHTSLNKAIDRNATVIDGEFPGIRQALFQ